MIFLYFPTCIVLYIFSHFYIISNHFICTAYQCTRIFINITCNKFSLSNLSYFSHDKHSKLHMNCTVGVMD